MPKPPFEIWFEFSSTYSYLSVMRVEALLRAPGIRFRWRPFLLGPIFRARGLETSPFVLDPVKGRYMWRDVERRAARFGLTFRRPPLFPMNSLSAARIMTAALETPWAGEFARAVFNAGFGRGEDIGDQTVLHEALEAVGVDADAWLARAREDEVKAALRASTEEAARHGIFGAPSFRVGGELFWGDDRLEDAIAYALGRALGPGARVEPPEAG